MASADFEHEWDAEMQYRADRWMDRLDDGYDEPDDREDRLWDEEE